jgi:NADH-quinone oxidoreductase subunit H
MRLAYLQWIERKVIARPVRVGPRRVGPHGLLQPLADVIKLVTKKTFCRRTSTKSSIF